MKYGKLFLLIIVIIVGGFTACKKGDAPSTDSSVNENTADTEQTDTNTEQQDTEQQDTEQQDTVQENVEQETSVENNDASESTSGELQSIIEKIYEIKSPEFMVGDAPVDLNDPDSVKYFTGLSDSSKIKEVAVSEPMMGSQAYSLVLVKLNQQEDAETVANEMLQGIDQRKWICVEADDLKVVAQGDVVMLIMVSSTFEDALTSQDIVDAFQEVRQAELDILLEK